MTSSASPSPDIPNELDSSGVVLAAATLAAAASSGDTDLDYEDMLSGLQAITLEGASLPEMPSLPERGRPSMLNEFRVDWDQMNDARCLEMTRYAPSSEFVHSIALSISAWIIYPCALLLGSLRPIF